MVEPQREDDRQQSFCQLTVELIEQAAALAGERASAPIRAAGARAARGLVVAAAIAGTLAVAIVFAAVAIGLLIGGAPPGDRWWICLLVALAFFVVTLVLAVGALDRAPAHRTRQQSDGE